MAQRIICHSVDRPVTPALRDGGRCGVDEFPGFHPGLFSLAPSGSRACGALRFVRSQVSEARPGAPSFVLPGPGPPAPDHPAPSSQFVPEGRTDNSPGWSSPQRTQSGESAQQQPPPPRRGGSNERNESSVIQAIVPSRRPYGTAGDVGWMGSPGFTRGYFRWLPPGAGLATKRFVRTKVSEARPGAPATLQRLRNSSRRDGPIIAPDGVRRSERNPGKAPSSNPLRPGGADRMNATNHLSFRRLSRHAGLTGRRATWGGWVARVSPGAIFVGSLRERGLPRKGSFEPRSRKRDPGHPPPCSVSAIRSGGTDR